MRATGRTSRIWLALVFCLGLWSPGQATARQWLFRCATSPLIAAQSGQRALAPGHPYAPLRSAMFFSQPDSACHWKSPRQHRG